MKKKMPKLPISKKEGKQEFPPEKLKILFEHMENSIMSESSLKKDWLSSEEDEAWKDL